MDELLTDQQQADVIKKWLKENGSFLIVGLILGLGGLFGWNSWKDYRAGLSEQASVVYDNLIRSIGEAQLTEAEEYERELATNYNNTPYLSQARFLMARLHLDRNEFDEAANFFQQIVDEDGGSKVTSVAKLRLARVRHHQQRYDEALAAIASVDANTSFAARFHEIRGDILLAQGQVSGARAEYEAALTADSEGAGLIDRGYVQTKLDRLDSGPDNAAADAMDLEPEAAE